MKKLFTFLAFVPFLVNAQKEELWRLNVKSSGGDIPVHISIKGQGDHVEAYALNADEKFQFDRVYLRKDTLHLFFDLYDMELVLVPKNNKIEGYLSKRGSDMLYRQAQLTGVKDDKDRFKNTKKLTPKPLANTYQVTFKNPTTGKESPAIGVFENKNGSVKGTFLTNTGDYRYLQGNVVGDSLYLSALGLNVYLYKAKIKGDSLVGGEQYTPFGKSSEFEGVKNEKSTLADPSKLTYLKEGHEKFDFTFKDINDSEVSLSDYKGNVTVVQILGTWCPNCLDETKFLMDYKKDNSALKIIGLAFERSTEPNYAYPKIGRFIERFKVDYPILLAGTIQ